MRLSRSFCFAPAVMIAAGFSAAQAQNLNDCPQISDDSARLACYDKVMQRGGTTAVALPPDVPAVPDYAPSVEPAIKQPETKPEEQFGLSQRPKNEPKQLEMDIAEIAMRANGKVKVTLTNGQIWRQISGDSTYLQLKSRPTKYSAVIKKAAMGSYRMKISPLHKTIRVRREK